jgi:hypothetical protein
MSSVALTGKDTSIIDTARVLADQPDGDVVVLEFPDNLCEAKPGKNGNTIYAFNASGKRVNVTLRIMRGSADDKYLNSRLKEYLNDPAAFVLVEAEFVKRVGDGAGNITADTYQLKGGVFQKMPGAKENVSGDTEQAVSIYALSFANSDRAIG